MSTDIVCPGQETVRSHFLDFTTLIYMETNRRAGISPIFLVFSMCAPTSMWHWNGIRYVWQTMASTTNNRYARLEWIMKVCRRRSLTLPYTIDLGRCRKRENRSTHRMAATSIVCAAFDHDATTIVTHKTKLKTIKQRESAAIAHAQSPQRAARLSNAGILCVCVPAPRLPSPF